MMDIRSALRDAARRGFAAAMLNPVTIPLYNRIFEGSPRRLADLLIKLQTAPAFDMVWTVRLLNGGTIRVPVTSDNPRSWEFAHAYHWHDAGIRDLEQVLFSRLLADGQNPIFLDIGANMGVRSLLPLAMGIHSVLFEPNPALHEFTEKVFALNRLDGYELQNLCLSNYCGSSRFYVSANSYTSSLDCNWNGEGASVNEIAVDVTTLDDWLAARADLAGRPAVAKIDVEGAELDVLAGARGFITERRPPLIVEVAIDAAHRKRVAEFCEQAGYRISVIRSSGTPALELLELLDRNQFVAMSHEPNFFFADAKWQA